MINKLKIETTTGTGPIDYKQVNDGDLIQYGDYALYFDNEKIHIAYFNRRTGTYSFMHKNKDLIIDLDGLDYIHNIFR